MGRLADGVDYPRPDADPVRRVDKADARSLPYEDDSVHLVVTSPPYWQKRDYGFEEQIGQEPTVDEFVDTIMDVLDEADRVLHPSGSIFLNVGDTYDELSLVGVSGRLRQAAADRGWLVRNDIVWAKGTGMPDPASNRLANRHEHILHLTRNNDYYYDLFGYEREYGTDSGDVWRMGFDRNTDGHLAPFPESLVERAITLAAPPTVCSSCGKPWKRVVRRTTQLDESRPQAKRAMEIYEQSELTEEHLEAIRAVGLSDAGKVAEVQDGTGRNRERVEELADEAKQVLGGYFREFLHPKKETQTWDSQCDCSAGTEPGVVLDPFVGTGTTVKIALENGLSGYGADLSPPDNFQATLGSQSFR